MLGAEPNHKGLEQSVGSVPEPARAVCPEQGVTVGTVVQPDGPRGRGRRPCDVSSVCEMKP